MKYNDRKNTPLKWNWVLRIVLLLEFIYLAYSFFNMMAGMLYVGSGNSIALTYLQNEGISLNDLGDVFWPIVIYILVEFISILIMFFAVYGLWRWKSYGPKCTIFTFFVRFLVFLMLLVAVIQVGSSNIELIDSLNLPLTNNEVIGLIIGLFLALSVYYLLQVVLNIVYYHKRKLLFNEYYVQPMSRTGGVVASQSEVKTTAILHDDSNETNEVKNVEDTASKDKEETSTTEVKEPSLEVKEEPHTTEVKDTSSEEHEEKETVTSAPVHVCPNCGKVVESDDANYCDNCGAKLK